MVRQFRVTGTYWSGSEYVSCETTKEFVDYWGVRDSDDLNSHIWRSNFDSNSPALKPDEIRHPGFDETNCWSSTRNWPFSGGLIGPIRFTQQYVCDISKSEGNIVC